VRMGRLPWQVAVAATLLALGASLLPYRRARRARRSTPAPRPDGAQGPSRRGDDAMVEQP
jgi:hypothetical protein